MTTREIVMSPLKVSTVLGTALLLWGALLVALTSDPAPRDIMVALPVAGLG